MFKVVTKKLALKCFALALLVFALFIFTKNATIASLTSTQERAKLSTVSIAPQDDAPLRIINTFIESEPGLLRLRVMAQNQSRKRIRAYAIVADGGAGSRVDFANLTSPTSIFQPTQIQTFDIAYSENQVNGPPNSVRLSVDFVEFDDGSTWGLDVHKSRDTLAGQREGAKAEKKRLRELLKSKGPSAVFDAIRAEVTDDPEVATTTKHSEEWLQGYRNGIGAIRHRLRQNLQTNDPARIELELARPFDTSEEQPK